MEVYTIFSYFWSLVRVFLEIEKAGKDGGLCTVGRNLWKQSNNLKMTTDIINRNQKLLVIGKTGAGKSTLCNVITGNDHNADIFPVSGGAESYTQRTKFANVCFKNLEISLIDTIGFDDATKNDDAKIISELVDKLQNQCNHVNLFVIAVNGQNPRLDGSLVEILKIFEGMFSETFWNQAMIVFTRMPMDKKSIRRRLEANAKKSDDDVAQDYIQLVQREFPAAASRNLKYLFLDACYDKQDTDEKFFFDTAMGKLGDALMSAPPLSTRHVREVETKTAALQRQIQVMENQRRQVEREFQEALGKLQKDMNMEREERDRHIRQLEKKFEDQGFSIWSLLNPMWYLEQIVRLGLDAINVKEKYKALN